MNYTARVLLTRYQEGIVVDEYEFQSEFNSGEPLTNRNEAFNYIIGLEAVFVNDLNERVLSLEDITYLPQNEKTGIYYESSIYFFSSCLDDEVNIFNPDCGCYVDSPIHWYQIGLVEELIELYNHMDKVEIDDYVTIDDFGRVLLKENLKIVKDKVADLERVWTKVINKK